MRLRWRATSEDGVAHAFGTLPKAPCGAPNQPEMFDWPSNSRCPICQQTEEEARKEQKAQLAARSYMQP